MEEFVITQKEAKQLWDKLFGVQYTVESMDYFRKKEGVKYIVWHKGDDSWTCDCKSWIYKTGLQIVRMLIDKVEHKTCKHMRFVMKEEGMEFEKVRYL